MNRLVNGLVVLVFTVPAGQAEADDQVPPPGYFTGVYERVGRDAATPPGLVNDLIRLAPNDQGGLNMWVCGQVGQKGPAADPSVIGLSFDRFGDVGNLLSGTGGDGRLGCQFFNDMDNYPILTCFSEGGRFTLWPANDPGNCPGED